MIYIKKLPKIYQNEINKDINNNKKIYRINNKYDGYKYNVVDFLNNLFNTKGYVFNIPVIIKTKDNLYDTYIISKKNNYILTIDNDLLAVNDIVYIKRKNP